MEDILLHVVVHVFMETANFEKMLREAASEAGVF